MALETHGERLKYSNLTFYIGANVLSSSSDRFISVHINHIY